MDDDTICATGTASSRSFGSDSGDDQASVAEQARKRRLVIIAAAAAAFVYEVSREMSKRQKRRVVRQSRLRVQTNVFDWHHDRHLAEVNNEDFRLMYRLTWDAFKKLLALLKPMPEPVDPVRAASAKYGERV